jgi:2-oxoisovalerate dehydrogenase E1 component
VLSALVDARHPGLLARVNSADSFIPLGPAAQHVLLDESEIVDAARELVAGASRAVPRIPSRSST